MSEESWYRSNKGKGPLIAHEIEDLGADVVIEYWDERRPKSKRTTHTLRKSFLREGGAVGWRKCAKPKAKKSLGGEAGK